MKFRTLVSATELSMHIDDVSWVIFDCRHDLARPEAGEQAYRAAHIPGAHFLHLDLDLSGPKTGCNGRHPLPDPATLAATLARLGVSNRSQVVAYDDAGGVFAARLWWLLRWLGHEDVAVLDGGVQAWERAGYVLNAARSAVHAATFSWRSAETIDTAFVHTNLGRPNMLLIDARAADRFRGENEKLDPVAGHIPGAVNRFFKENLAPDGRFKTALQLRDEFNAVLGGRTSTSAVCYCGSGVTACHHLLAMEIAALHGARLYPGSWSEWCSDPHRPCATGAEYRLA